MLRFCIVGAGFIGGVHAQALAEIPLAKVTVICDRDCDRASALASKTGAVCVTDYREAVLREDVDVVCICTPSGRHAEVAIAAAEAGKHLVVEKPLEINLERIDRMLEAASGAGVQLTCIFPLRFMHGVDIARAALQEGRLGKLVMADAIIKWYRSQAYYDQGGWKGTWELDGGGALMNQGIHTIDLLYHLAGPVTQVCGRIATLAHRMETEDTAAAVVQFRNGALGVIVGSTVGLAWRERAYRAARGPRQPAPGRRPDHHLEAFRCLRGGSRGHLADRIRAGQRRRGRPRPSATSCTAASWRISSRRSKGGGRRKFPAQKPAIPWRSSGLSMRPAPAKAGWTWMPE